MQNKKIVLVKNLIYLVVILLFLLQLLCCSKDKTAQNYVDEYYLHLRNGENIEAYQTIDEMAIKYPELAAPHFFKANLYQSEKKFFKEEEELLLSLDKYDKQKIKEQSYSLNIVYQHLAVVYFQLKKYENAINFLEEAVKIDSKNVRTYRLFAINYMELGQFEKALLHVNLAIELDSEVRIDELYGLYDVKFDIFYRMNNYKGQIDILNKKLEKTSNDSLRMNIITFKAVITYKNSKFEELINLTSEELRYKKDSIFLYFFRGLGYLGKSDFEKAGNDFNLINTKFNREILYHLLMILTKLIEGKKEKAEYHFNKINLTKNELNNSEDYSFLIDFISYYPPHKQIVMDFIEAQPE